MTVGELITILNGLPSDLLVMVCDGERKPVNSVAINYELPVTKYNYNFITFFTGVTPDPEIRSVYELMKEEEK